MCGITGLVKLAATAADPSADRLAAMSAAVTHRGPDDSGAYVSPDGLCRLGHRRLSVIDLACGHQPLSNEDGTVWIVFNGEIYNFQELRPDLEKRGHLFRTHSDTEVLVHLWEEHGPAMVERLRGMFAFAIWDQKRRALFLARDPLGKKPLYYGEHDGLFRFGSELKTLMSDPAFPRDVDPDAVLLYLHMGYVPHPWTILRNAKKLSPGHWLLVENGSVRIERYWQPPRRATFSGSLGDACHQLRELMTRATQRRLIADVPLGAFLSGGIDSTIVVGLMSRLRSEPVKTFTIGFEEAKFNEAAFARRVAKKFNTAHHEMIVRPDALEVLPTLAHHYDEPFADSSAIPTYYVSKLTRQHVTVALTGDGGDETFGGYRRYRTGKVLEWLSHVPGARSALGVGRHLISESVDRTTNLGRAKRMLDTLGNSDSDSYLAQMTQFGDSTFESLLAPDFAEKVNRNLPSEWFGGLYRDADPNAPAAAAMFADLESYLPGDILTKVDIASMSIALECRSPFLDRDVVDFACSLPTEWRLRGFANHKYILKRAFADLLPRQIVNRRKTGFAVPLPEWFRGPLRGLLYSVLLDPSARSHEFVNGATVRVLVEEHTSGQKNHASSLWTLLMLEMWFKTWSGR